MLDINRFYQIICCTCTRIQNECVARVHGLYIVCYTCSWIILEYISVILLHMAHRLGHNKPVYSSVLRFINKNLKRRCYYCHQICGKIPNDGVIHVQEHHPGKLQRENALYVSLHYKIIYK